MLGSWARGKGLQSSEPCLGVLPTGDPRSPSWEPQAGGSYTGKEAWLRQGSGPGALGLVGEARPVGPAPAGCSSKSRPSDHKAALPTEGQGGVGACAADAGHEGWAPQGGPTAILGVRSFTTSTRTETR